MDIELPLSSMSQFPSHIFYLLVFLHNVLEAVLRFIFQITNLAFSFVHSLFHSFTFFFYFGCHIRVVLLSFCPPLPSGRLLSRPLISYNPKVPLYQSPMLHESWQEVLQQLSIKSSFLELYFEFLASALVPVIRSFFCYIRDNLGRVPNFVLASLLAQGRSPYPQPPVQWHGRCSHSQTSLMPVEASQPWIHYPLDSTLCCLQYLEQRCSIGVP